jgi:DNA-binding CsgD family transcriptional regulator
MQSAWGALAEGRQGTPLSTRERERAVQGRADLTERAPSELEAHPFQFGGDEYVLLSFSLTPNRLQADLLAELTDAERGVVELVAQRRSNAEIAQLRGTSPRTVANQVAAIFRKLGVSSRREFLALHLRSRDDHG